MKKGGRRILFVCSSDEAIFHFPALFPYFSRNDSLPGDKRTVVMHEIPATTMDKQRGQRRPHRSITTQQAM